MWQSKAYVQVQDLLLPPDSSLFLVCYAATQLATQLRQRCKQVVRSNKEARKRLTKSNGTPAMDPGHMNIVFTNTFAYSARPNQSCMFP